jgi:hypothetical protein
MSRVSEFKEPKLYAEEKLEEALYFLLQMRHSYVDRREFIFNLNAFLNSARNITWVLKKEFAQTPELEAWYASHMCELQDDKLGRFFIELRNVSTKEKTPSLTASLKWAYVIPVNEKLDAFGYTESKVSGDEKDSDSLLVLPTYDKNGKHKEPKLVSPTYSLVTLWEFEKPPKGYATTDILGLCALYYEKLKLLLGEAGRELRKTIFDGKVSSHESSYGVSKMW